MKHPALLPWMERGLKVGDLSTILHVYPTYSDASMQAAAHIRIRRLLKGMSGQILRRVVRLLR